MELRWLKSEEAESFSEFTVSALRPLLPKVCQPTGQSCNYLSALGMYLVGQPIALLLLQVQGQASPKHGQILSLAVAPHAQRQGVARRMMTVLTQTCIAMQLNALSVAFPTERESAMAMQRLTDSSLGWRQGLNTILCTGDRENTQRLISLLIAPARRIKDSLSLRISPITDVTTLQLQQVAQAEDLPPWANPLAQSTGFDSFATVETAMCRALWMGDSLVGWSFCHRVSEGTVRVSLAWINAELQRNAAMVPLLNSVLEAFIALGTENPMAYEKVSFGIDTTNQAMTTFSKKRILPLCSNVVHSTERWLAVQSA